MMKDPHNDQGRSHLERAGWLTLIFILICWATVEFFVFLSSEAEARDSRPNVCRDIAHRVVTCPLGQVRRNVGPVRSSLTDELDMTLTLLLPKRG